MTITWTRNAGEMASEAYARILALPGNGTMSAYQWTRAMAHLNGLLKALQVGGENRWRRTNQTINLVEGTTNYTLSPRPDRVRSVFHVDGNDRELPMAEWTFDDYDTLPNKAQKGRPTIWVEDRQRAETNLYIWPTADATNASYTLRVSYDRVMEDISQQSDIVDVPQEWIDPLTDTLGGRLATNLRIENPSAQEVKQRGEAWMRMMLESDHEESITFTMGASQ